MPRRGCDKPASETTSAELGLSADRDLGAKLVMTLQADTCHIPILFVTGDEDAAIERAKPPGKAGVVRLDPTTKLVEIDELIKVAEDPEAKRVVLTKNGTDALRQLR